MDNCKYRHILFLSYKDICYNSTSYFEQRISEELINAGIKVTHLNIPKPAKVLADLVDEIPLIAEVEQVFCVHKGHKRGRGQP